MTKFTDKSVEAIFNDFSPGIREKLIRLRELIFETAKVTPRAGKIEEVLKWRQPSYLTSETKNGSTIRIDSIPSQPDKYVMYFHCQTSLIETFKDKFGDKFQYQGNRALIFSESEEIPEIELSECISLALTYHIRNQKNRPSISTLIGKNRGRTRQG